MKKNKNIKSPTFKKLLLTGAAILITTPLAQYIIINLLTRDCPETPRTRECGWEAGFSNAYYTIALTIIWAMAGATFLIIGLVRYFGSKKNR